MNSTELYGRFEKFHTGLRKKQIESVRNSACNHLRSESASAFSGFSDEWIIRFPGEKDFFVSCEELTDLAAPIPGSGSQNDIIVQEDGIFRINTALLPSRPVFNEDFKELVDSVLQEPSV